ncbi:HD domain-containing phosphohydrolase [uncultured Thiodictyon sp.]|uniref:HD-GYP domain-containing protein n=1 Tax=uncultured Thiodictyon sp. TaxID=1846217 RepID=UPI0025DAA3D9|nr:HD domain-containing phosphohydrolase [uncultured Thiodictyon sp.]
MIAPPQATLLIVDDAAENLALLGDLLYPTYRVLAANSGARALRMASGTPRPDLILLDVMMPQMGGYEVFERLRADPLTRDIPVIFLTALDSPEAELHGLTAGAADYLTKPIRPNLVLARVRTQLEVKLARDWLKDQNAFLEAEIARRMMENEATQAVAIRALAHLAETRDGETGNHIRRTQAFVSLLANRLRADPRFAATLDQGYIDLLTRSAPLHDIGKVGVPDAILRKPGALSAEERRIMQTHAHIGADAIALAQQDLERPLAFLTLAQEVARWHHERWDGRGYPDGLAGEAIPICARIMSLADVFDALVSPRVYKPALSLAEARAIIAAGRGTQFDPDVTDAFLADFTAFAAIAEGHRDLAAAPPQ